MPLATTSPTETETAVDLVDGRGSRVPSRRPHLLTVCVEDYFQVGAFRDLFDESRWDRFENRLARGLGTTLELLDRHDVTATFFVLGWIAERWPELVRDISDRGHEVACRGYDRRRLHETTAAELRDDLARTRRVLETVTGRRVWGHRSGSGWLRASDGYVLDLVAETGFAYDSSLLPRMRRLGAEGRFTRRIETARGPLWEVPPSAVRMLGHDVPVAGGAYFRQLPEWFLRRSLADWDRTRDVPFVLYFHTWELDPEQPRVDAAGRLTRVRHYRNLDRVSRLLDEFLSSYDFGPIRESLGLADEPTNAGWAVPTIPEEPNRISSGGHSPPYEDRERTPISIVIPCFNEEATIPFLARTLVGLRAALAREHEPEFVFVDDCSTDNTADTLEAVFGIESDCRVVRHETNQGVAAAILTGIEAASHEVVCSMDCDCSYDPHELVRMLPRLTNDIDLVTASPYHPEGGVKNVPSWRLVLSRSLSWMYARVLPAKLHTYTSCFRVHRRSAFAGMQVSNGGFLGVAEMLAECSRRGGTVVEHPATLSVRLFGESKMKTLRCIRQHLGLLARLALSRDAEGSAPRSTTLDATRSPAGRG